MTPSLKLLPILALAAALAACGGNPTKPETAAEGRKLDGLALSEGVTKIATEEGKVELTKDDRVRCEKYKPLGSNRTQYRCTTVAEKKASEEENAAAMRRLQTPPPSANSSIGR